MISMSWLLLKGAIIRNLHLLGIIEPYGFFNKALAEYRAEMDSLPEFGKNDVLKLNLSQAVMLSVIYQNCEPKPDIGTLMKFYHDVVFGNRIIAFALSQQNILRPSYVRGQKRQAAKSQNGTHPFTWQYTVEAHDADRFTATFTRCGIHDYLNSRGMGEIVPAMCALDYSFAEVGKHLFLRNSTIATGGGVCDCHYIRKSKATKKEQEEFLFDQSSEAVRGGATGISAADYDTAGKTDIYSPPEKRKSQIS